MVFWYGALGALVIIALTALLNVLTFPRLRKPANNKGAVNPQLPRFVVLIPARNEAARIGATIRSLLEQNYPYFEIHVLDDHSTDGTAQAAKEARNAFIAQAATRPKSPPPLHVHPGSPLPPGWLGKNWACSQLADIAAQETQAEWLIFTDADVHWAPGALAALAAQLEHTHADMLTVWPTQQTQTWAERLVVPMMLFTIIGYLPEIAVRFLPWASFAAANGQCLVFRRSAYDQVGGHTRVRDKIIEDVELARATKRSGLRLVMVLGNQMVKTRMYTSWSEARDGFAKNILAGHGSSPLFLLVSTVFHWALFLVSWLWLALGWALPGPAYPAVPLALVGLGLGVRLLAASATHHRLADAFLLPVSVILFTLIAAKALWWHYAQGGPTWKGRVASTQAPTPKTKTSPPTDPKTSTGQSSASPPARVVVIGGGIGGLSAAIHLQSAGRSVLLLEANPQVGGKMSEFRQDGFRWDTGPSVITMRHVFEDLFKSTGRRLEDHLEFTRVDPLTRYFYPNGKVLDVVPYGADGKMAAEIARVGAPEDVEGYARFLAYAAELHRITGPVFIYDRPPGLRSFLKVSPLDIFKVDGLRTMDQAARQFVQSPELRQVLGRFATYVGASPYLAPATLNVIAHVELNQGVWYPAGGVYSIAKALERLARELGVEIQTGQKVRQVNTTAGRAVGVTLENGGQIAASAVVANLDTALVYEQLLAESHAAIPSAARRARQLARREPSCSGFILLLGVRGEHPPLAHHNIFFSANYPLEFEQLFREGIPPSEPTIYVAITSKSTPGDAPAGHENWFVLVNAPALDENGRGWDWQTQRKAYRDLVLNRLAETFGLDVREQIVSETILTPVEIERWTGARRGALYGASSNNRWAAFLRPHNRSKEVKGVYFAGGTTHPGGGVPMVALSGKAAASLLLEDDPS